MKTAKAPRRHKEPPLDVLTLEIVNEFLKRPLNLLECVRGYANEFNHPCHVVARELEYSLAERYECCRDDIWLSRWKFASALRDGGNAELASVFYQECARELPKLSPNMTNERSDFLEDYAGFLEDNAMMNVVKT